MIIKWIFPESEELLGIRRNKGDSFEIDDNVGKQLIAQGKAQKTAQDMPKNDDSDRKSGKSKGNNK
jgi:hypothetical protein